MKAIISSTYDDKYLFFLPIVNWAWNKLGVDVICFMPQLASNSDYNIYEKWIERSKLVHSIAYNCRFEYFKCPDHKQATYAQCSRLYAGALDIPNEVLISSDIDMMVLKNIFENHIGNLWNIGFDLVPESQLPICYTWGETWLWDYKFDVKGKSVQECLDEQLAHEDSIHMKGDLWSRDQELMAKAFAKHKHTATVRIPRARTGTTFAANRLDRDDAFLLDRLNPDIIDFHMPRPGYEDKSFEIILSVLKYFYPNDDFQWLINYRTAYIQLL